MTRGAVAAAVAVAVFIVAAAGCATTVRTAEPMSIAGRAGEILATGRAEVPGPDGMVTVAADEVVSVRLVDRDGVERPVRLTVRELVDGCVDDLDADGCLAAHAVVDEPAVTRRDTHVDKTQVAAVG